jgi:1-acylglycerone phosphate reductase
MPTPAFAARIVGAALSKGGAPRYISIGSNSTLFKVFKWLPRGIVLWLLWKKIGLMKK